MYIKASEAAKKWDLSLRRVQDLCKLNMIPGACRWGRDWMIPVDAQKPVDGRSKMGKSTKAQRQHQPLLRKSPFLTMTNLYHQPGSADHCIEELAKCPNTQGFFKAEIACFRGQIDDVYDHAKDFLNNRSGFYAVMAGGMLLAQVALWKGDTKLWDEAHRHFYDAPHNNKIDRDIVALAMASSDCAIRGTDKFPEWFRRGCFDNLPQDAHPAARVYYAKYLLILAQECAMGNHTIKDVKGLGVMRVLPYLLEPMISQMVVEKIIMAETYLRLIAAIAYRQSGDDLHAGIHLDRAIRVCLADGLYGPLVEYRRQLGLFLDDHLAAIDPQALKKVKTLYKQYHIGWTKVHNAILSRNVHDTLTIREREVARLASYGLTNQEIAHQLSISPHTVRSLLDAAKDKIGSERRIDLALYI